MTEQEKREKAIKELYDKFKKWANENFTISYSGATVMSVPSVEGLLTRIVLYVLRKEEEVRKETAKEIIHFLKEKGSFGYDYPDSPHSPIVTFDPCIFEDIENEYGVEVDE